MRKYTWVFVLIGFVFVSCVPDSETTSDETINEWIDQQMRDWYYWESKIPGRVDKSLNPDVFFESLLYRYDPVNAPDGDRFSWIQSDWRDLLSSLEGVVPNEIGFEYDLYRVSEETNDVMGFVTYVKHATPAELSGIQRGWWLSHVNGEALNTTNYSSLLRITEPQAQFQFRCARLEDGAFVGWQDTSVQVQTLSSFAENPVYLDTVYSEGATKVGYLVYHFFAPGEVDSETHYDAQLNQAFARFKEAEITELIVDLRYNSGGYATSGTNLASMIVPRSGGKQLFTYYRYNSYIQNALESRYGKEVSNTYFSDYLLSPDGAYLDPIVNIGNQLSRVYILTGPYTASASEALISGLRPYMEVITIGKTTYGKNVASISIYDETNSENMWGLQPIVAKVYNSLDASDYTGGFEATIPADEVQAGARALGDRLEELLSVALSDIQGQATLRGATSEQAIGMSLRRIPSNRYGDHRGLVLPSMQVFE